MVKNIISQPIKRLKSSHTPNEKGQSIVLITFAFLGMLAMLGIALDLGLVYIEQLRLKRALDAAALAAAVELPNEEKAILRAMQFLDENGYTLRNSGGQPQVNIYVRGCAHNGYLSSAGLTNKGGDLNADPYLYFPAGGALTDPIAEFTLDTRSYQLTDGSGVLLPENDPDLCNPGATFGTATRFHVGGNQFVRMNFMQFFGFGRTPVSDVALGQNITSLDVAIIFDVSGSMQFDTICHGCYEQFGDGSKAWTDLDYGYAYPITDTVNSRFPKTFIYPIPTSHLQATSFQAGGQAGIGSNSDQLCYGRDGNLAGYHIPPGASNPKRYVIIEGELYTKNNSTYDPSFRQPGQGYWAVQHTELRTVHRMVGAGWDPDSSYAIDATPILPGYSRGSWVSHHPYVEWSVAPAGGDPGVPFGFRYSLTDAQANESTSLHYEFFTSNDWNSNDTRIWIRGQSGNSAGSDLYWAIYDNTPGVDAFNPAPLGNQIRSIRESAQAGPMYGGSDSNRWNWLELTGASPALDLANSTKYTLKIWSGSPGYDIDQIVIANTTDTSGFTSNYGGGVASETATPGSAFGEACNRCNSIYGQNIGQAAHCLPPHDNGANAVSADGYDTMTQDPLFGGYQPIRDTKEAVKRFIDQLQPQVDQVGVVAYNHNTASARSRDLNCLRSNPNTCAKGASIGYTNVLELVEILPAEGGTNIAQGMRDGLYILGIDADNRGDGTRPGTLPPVPGNCGGISCGRGSSAKRLMIVLTDGVANADPNGACDDDSSLYLPNTGTSSIDQARDCVVYYAQKAAAANVTIYTIGLGNGSDVALMERAAEIGRGEFFAAASPSRLDEIFDAILSASAVRLIE